VSSIASAIFLWLFTIGLVTSQWWLLGLAVVVLIVLLILFRGRGAAAIALISTASASLVMATHQWPVRMSLGQDPFAAIRNLAANSISGVSIDSASLVLGLAVGDDSKVSQELSSALKLTSLTHLMAVSGANCAIVIGAVYFLLFRLSIRKRVFCSVVALVAYVGLVGLQPSVLRAASMAIAVMFALVLGRKVNPLSALALSVLFLLCAAPELATSYAFALSVLATAGILIVAPNVYRKLASRLPSWLAMGLAVSIGAQLFCFPVLLGLQGGVPTYSILANLLCEPLVAPITVLGLLGILFLWFPPLASLLFWLASLVAWPITALAKTLSHFPFATLPWRVDFSGVTLAICFVAFVLLALNTHKIGIQNLSWIAAVSILACSFGVILNQAVRVSLWPIANWQVASCDVGQGDATVIRDHEEIAVIDVGRDEYKIDNCLNKLGVKHINLLVLTHFDADHVNGLSGALKNRKIDLAMLTSFFDERPGADFSRFLLNSQNIGVIKAEQGMTGQIGQSIWKVLSPSRTAEEAEDSNDASVTMLWRFEDFQLITLADLGEKGQRRLAANLGTWWREPEIPLVMKVSHHGSADQYPELLEWLKPKLALISVGTENGYGHPTKRTLDTLSRTDSVILRTDLLGSIALQRQHGEFELSYSGSS